MYCVPLNNIVVSKYLIMVIIIIINTIIRFQLSRVVGNYVILGCKRHMLVNHFVVKFRHFHINLDA